MSTVAAVRSAAGVIGEQVQNTITNIHPTHHESSTLVRPNYTHTKCYGRNRDGLASKSDY